jgi:redox-sensitive bicupin YhaK (pirin superfamily)
MITVRRSEERGHTRLDWLDSYHTFSFDTYFDPHHVNFGALRVINEDRVNAGEGFRPHGHKNMDIVTIVLEGALAHQDSLGNGSVIHAGDVQRMTAGTGITHSEYNHSQVDPVHFLQIWILPEAEGLEPGYEQKTFSSEPARNHWQQVVSRDGRAGSVTVNQDLNLYRAYIDPGKSVPVSVQPNRQVWLHVVCGELSLDGAIMSDGDSAGLRTSGDFLLEAASASEVYLFEMTYSEETIVGEDV